MERTEPDHAARVIDQFSRQAGVWAGMRGATHEDALRLLVGAARAGSGDAVLDVGCGAGQVALAFAAVAGEVTGIDLTPAMIERARALQAERAVRNVRWVVGDVCPLPFGDAAFSVVTCRYALHHFPDPGAAVGEMVRVCAPGGRVVLADVFTTAERAEAFDHLERLRDPSHVRALTLEEMVSLATSRGLLRVRSQFYRMEVDLEGLLRASFPPPGNAARVRERIVQDIGRDELGLGAEWKGSEVRLGYPIALIVGEKPGGR
jgi:ubiquinone/menaquinone biosynthesis C-methylase UbiE